MVDASLVQILVCPETHQPVHIADEETVSKVNAAISAGTLKNREGEAVQDQIETGLIREDGAYLYPVWDGIPTMLVGDAIALGDL